MSPAAIPVAERLAARSVRVGDCLRWTGAHNELGYGKIKHNGRKVGVHVAAYEVSTGPVPAGFDVDHVAELGCSWRDCIEPGHLEAISHGDNLRRSPLVGHREIPHDCSDTRTRYIRRDGEFCPTCTALPSVARIL